MTPPNLSDEDGDPSSLRRRGVVVRNTTADDIDGVQALCREVYPKMPAWSGSYLRKHQEVFPRGQLVAVDEAGGEVIGMAASLVILWEDYDRTQSWAEFTSGGTFDNHDPEGRTLYGAEVMVSPRYQGRGVGSLLYEARRRICRSLGLRRIRAGARLPGYSAHASAMPVDTYVRKVVRGELGDPTLSFQLKQGFSVIAVVEGYLRSDEESCGYAALIEWLNPDLATEEEQQKLRARYG